MIAPVYCLLLQTVCKIYYCTSDYWQPVISIAVLLRHLLNRYCNKVEVNEVHSV